METGELSRLPHHPVASRHPSLAGGEKRAIPSSHEGGSAVDRGWCGVAASPFHASSIRLFTFSPWHLT